eukprot:1157685-Pelagomonas_calceolata.AAC.13
MRCSWTTLFNAGICQQARQPGVTVAVWTRSVCAAQSTAMWARSVCSTEHCNVGKECVCSTEHCNVGKERVYVCPCVCACSTGHCIVGKECVQHRALQCGQGV